MNDFSKLDERTHAYNLKKIKLLESISFHRDEILLFALW